eukprot:748595-Pleurochrysis_carterae.AAC.1
MPARRKGPPDGGARPQHERCGAGGRGSRVPGRHERGPGGRAARGGGSDEGGEGGGGAGDEQ